MISLIQPNLPVGFEIRHGRRQQQQRRGEDRRDDARGVDFQRQVGRVAAEHLVAHLSLRVLDENAALRALHEDDEGDDRNRHHQKNDDEDGRDRAGSPEFERGSERVRQVRDNTGHDDQRDAVADPARGDLLAEPHQKDRAADERHHGHQPEEQPGIEHRGLRPGMHPLQPDRDPIGLDRRQQDSAEAGVLVQLLAPALAFLLQRFECRGHRSQELDDDRCRNVRHDVQAQRSSSCRARRPRTCRTCRGCRRRCARTRPAGSPDRCRGSGCRCRADRSPRRRG